MSEEEIMSVEDQQPQADAQATETENAPDARQEESQEDRRRRNDVEYNWGEARRKMQEMDRQIREQQEYIEEMKRSKTPPKEEEDDLDRLSDDDIITKAHAKKLAAKMAKEIAAQVVKEHTVSTLGERVKNRFPDYDDVVTQENIDLLKKQMPAVANSLMHNPDPYDQAVAVYDALKLMGGTMASNKPNPEKAKAVANSQKPMSVNAVTKNSAIGNAHMFENGLTKELKAQLWKEMQDAAKYA